MRADIGVGITAMIVPGNVNSALSVHIYIYIYIVILVQMIMFYPSLLQVKREEVDRRVKEQAESYSNKFSEQAKSMCQEVSRYLS